jgi:MFS family permease
MSATMTDAEHARYLRRAIIAATIGTTIEWYDFFLYSTVTGLVFGKLFFPDSEPLVGTLQAFLIYAVGFAARPIGAAIFGHFGDRAGRKSTLIATLMLMGIATFLIGLVPSHEAIGIWGAVLLTLLRFVQGVGVGGEWGGSVLLSMEWARTHRHRGFIAAWPQFGVPAGLFLANLAVLAFSGLSGDSFLVWGWRAPFLISIVLVGVGFYIRVGIVESPTFSKLAASARRLRTPTLAVLRSHPREIALSALARLAEQAPFYIFTAFVFSYGTGTLGVSRDLLLTGVLIAAAFSFISIPMFGHLSDRVGRRRMYMIGCGAMGAFGFVYIALMNSGSSTLILCAVVLSLIPHDMLYGPQAALIAESFPPEVRYSGASLGYQLASIIAGGPAPIIATALLAASGSGWSIAGYILACSTVSLGAAAFMPDHTNRPMAGESIGAEGP